MPIYEYECDACNHRFEMLKSSMTKDSVEKCPKCGQDARQQFSTFGVGREKLACESSCESPCKGSGCASGGCPFSGR